MSHIRDVEQHHIELDCFVASTEIHELITTLPSHLTPFAPSLLIQQLDILYYLVVDHCTDQEIMMLQLGFQQYQDHNDIHNQLLDALTNAKHRQLYNHAEMAAELISQLEQLASEHEKQENTFSQYRESLRFRR